MTTYIIFTNNVTLTVKNSELKENIVYGQHWLAIKYKNKPEVFIPHIHIARVERSK